MYVFFLSVLRNLWPKRRAWEKLMYVSIRLKGSFGASQNMTWKVENKGEREKVYERDRDRQTQRNGVCVHKGKND